MTRRNDAATKGILTLISAMILAAVGCDKEESRADRNIHNTMARAAMVARGEDQKTEQAIRSATTRPLVADQMRTEAELKLIAAAMGEAKASEAAKALAAGRSAQAHYALAVRLEPQLANKVAEARSLLREIEALAGEVRQHTAIIKGLQLSRIHIAQPTGPPHICDGGGGD
jgi:hypothetical protein